MSFNIPNLNLTYEKPTVKPEPYVRRNDWATITGVTNDEMLFLVSDIEPYYKINVERFSGSGTCYVDWGDGSTPDAFTTATTIEHSYVGATGGTVCALGYKTWVVRVYSDDPSNTVINHAYFTVHSQYRRTTGIPIGLLEAWYGNNINFVLAPTLFNSISTLNFFNLTYVRLPQSMPNTTNLNQAFRNCISLRKIDMPTSAPNLLDLTWLVDSCALLDEIAIPQDALSVTTFNSAFQNCYVLTKVTLPPSMNNVTSVWSMFNNCYLLGEVELPALPAVTDLRTVFSACYSLTNIKIPALNTAVVNTLENTFLNCVNLENVEFPRGDFRINLNTTFSGCRNLKRVFFPKELANRIVAMNATFQNCSSLTNVTFPTNNDDGVTLLPQPISTFANTFNSCTALEKVTFPPYDATNAIAANTSFASTFLACNSLTEIVIPGSYQITSLASLAQNCFSLVKAHIATGTTQTVSSISFSTMFSGCRNLIDVVFPSSFTSNAGTFANAFTNCASIENIVLPSNLNIISFANSFQNCFNLKTITLPTQCNNLQTYANAFESCYNLREVILPTPVAGNLITTFFTAFRFCFSLETVTLPNIQLTALSNTDNMFTSCYSLRTINNFDKLGNTATNGTLVTATGVLTASEEYAGTLTFSPRLSRLHANGSASFLQRLSGVRLLNTGTGQWTGSSPQINVSYTELSTAALIQLFNDMAAQGNVTSKTINITGATGAAGLTATDRQIITTRGWTITG